MQSSQLKSILSENALISYEPSREVVLKEEVTELSVTQMPSDVSVVDMDIVGHLPGVGRGVLRRICDFLLVSSSDSADQAVFVELKKTLRENKKGMEKLRRSLPILEYLDSSCRIHHDDKKKDRSSPSVRYFLIGEQNSLRLDKQRLRPRPYVQTEKYKDIEVHTFLGGRIRFDQLFSKAVVK